MQVTATCGRRLTALAMVAAVVSGCDGTPRSGSGDPYAPLRGLVLESDDLAPRSLAAGGLFSLPAAATAYTVSPGRTEDLRALAERYAGGPVTEGAGPNLSRGLTSFATRDGWFVAPTGKGNDASAGGWSWYEAAWREQSVHHPVPMTQGTCPEPPDVSTEQAALTFFERVGVHAELVRPATWQYVGDQTIVDVYPLVDGVPLVQPASALVDATGTVVEAGGPLMRLTSIGQVDLAPAAEVLRRLAEGDGRVGGNCVATCTLRTNDAHLALAFASNGGLGGHDHTPGGVVDAAASHVLVPVLMAPGDASYPGSLPDVSYSAVLAVSSAVLVDDPDQADAARRVEATSGTPSAGPACAGEPEVPQFVCTTRSQATVGVPVLLTANGERYEPVGARGCAPLFTLDPGDGSGPQSFRPRSGTLITARVAHTYAEPGTYDVVLREASRCSTPAPGGGTEPEYDRSVRITVTVTP